MRKYKIKNKPRFLVSMSLFITIIMLSSFTLAVNAKNSDDLIFASEYVEEGDTLWSLSKPYNNDNTDIREYISKVMEINNLKSANIKPGDLIYFPVYK
jgi:hypothetical protein